MVFTNQVRLERHVAKAHKKKYSIVNRNHNWYAAGAASGHI